jgi:hypothetical protein
MEHNAHVTPAFSQLRTTLSKLYPIEHWTVSTAVDPTQPYAPRFCWDFFRADPETLSRLGEALRNYEGSVSWVFWPSHSANATCLVAVQRGAGQFTAYPPINTLEDFSLMESPPLATEEFVDKAVAGLLGLCTHLERYLGLERSVSKSFDSRLVAPTDPPMESALPDFVERGTHVAWIVYAGAEGGTGDKATGPNNRRRLHFGVNANEWRSIYTEVLDKASASFPLLAGIQDGDSIYFRGPKVQALRQECLRARASTSTPLTIRGLDKLILLCNWVQQLGGDLFLAEP